MARAATPLRVAIGTYDKQVCGLEWPAGEESRTLFAFTAHLGCVKTLAGCGKYFVSGATDESIRVFNMQTLKDLGTLFHHTGTITALAFHKRSHLFSGSEDGTICVWRTRDWEMLTALQAQEPVVDIALHESGRLLLATYKNRVIRMWDLVKGRCGWKKNLPKVGEIVVWGNTPETEFAVAAGSTVTCYQDGQVTFTMENEAPVLAMVSIPQFNLLICGTADGRIQMWSCVDGTRTAVLGAHQERIRSLEMNVEDGACYLVSASSSGILKMWEIVSPKLLRMVQEVNVDCRLTAMCLANEVQEEVKPPRKRKSDKIETPKSILKTRAPAATEEEAPKAAKKKKTKAPAAAEEESKVAKKKKTKAPAATEEEVPKGTKKKKKKPSKP
eukprot:TRINITY_DN5671_c0_g1_i3.p1 TRINITY_DN5671_c0_g1~~TRINITY_DN5671_c0_g1_i3.p1  ORF type:complete len:386 (+),score=77.62 TRINITY_DN5671_c0_g1_i3:199-1356(+)